MFVDRRPDALDVLPGEYREVFDRLLDVAVDDERVVRVWLAGSLGRGAGDAGSDLDVVLQVADLAFDPFTQEWREWLERVTPTVLAKELPGMPGSWYSLTPKCARFDAVVVRESTRSTRLPRSRRLLVFDRQTAEMNADVSNSSSSKDIGPGAEPGPGPDPAKLADLVEEFLRQQATFHPSVVARGDWLLGVVAIELVHSMLYQLFVEANQPLPPSGVKQWSAKLNERQRRRCAELLVPRPERDAIIAAMRECAAVYRAEAKAILDTHAVPWPDALDAAVRGQQARTLGWPAEAPAGTER
jgi:predicted nucleotidyltransferase